MKVTNIMNFVRTFEPRDPECEKKLFDTAKAQLELSLEMNLPSTFLLEYDALCDERYVEIFVEASKRENIEIGVWYEIVEPLTSAIGMNYASKKGYKWDWAINPGFPMSYTPTDRERLVDEVMRKFKEIFNFYPSTFASWVLDTHTVRYLKENYPIEAFMICRDQINTDAYTFVGGYFNGPYYPSKNNIFTPARDDKGIGVPVFRLLSPDPIHNYDSTKHLSPQRRGTGVFTMEPACESGRMPEVISWYLDTFYNNESLSVAYTQVGQENSFAYLDIVSPLRMQYNMLKDTDVEILTVAETARRFQESYDKTPPASVIALKNWDSIDASALHYSSSRYTASLMYREGVVFLRALYLFDERVRDYYLDSICETEDSIYENLPIVDTWYQRGESDGGLGIILGKSSETFSAYKSAEGELTVEYSEGKVIFREDRIYLGFADASFAEKMNYTEISHTPHSIEYSYRGTKYSLEVEGGEVTVEDGVYRIKGKEVSLIPKTK